MNCWTNIKIAKNLIFAEIHKKNIGTNLTLLSVQFSYKYFVFGRYSTPAVEISNHRMLNKNDISIKIICLWIIYPICDSHFLSFSFCFSPSFLKQKCYAEFEGKMKKKKNFSEASDPIINWMKTLLGMKKKRRNEAGKFPYMGPAAVVVNF